MSYIGETENFPLQTLLTQPKRNKMDEVVIEMIQGHKMFSLINSYAKIVIIGLG